MAEQALHVFFIPHLASSHIISMLDVARIFAQRGVRVSIAATNGNASRFRRTVQEVSNSGHSMHLHLLPFPSAEVGLPAGCEDAASLVPPTESNMAKYYQAVRLLQRGYVQLLLDHRPDCVVTDIIDGWTPDVGITCLLFCAISPFCIHIFRSIIEASLSPNSNGNIGNFDADYGDGQYSVAVGGLPHRVKMEMTEIPDVVLSPEFLKLLRKVPGMVVNSVYEMTPGSVDEYCKGLGEGWKLWCVGPLFIHNKTDVDEAERGGGGGGGGDEIWGRVKAGWLDLQPHGSVLYVCFGSEHTILSQDQYREIAWGLESSGHAFVWVVKETAGWLPDDFEDRVRGRGVMWRGWAPQLQILSHPAIGGYITHCGWNSITEAVCFGVPMIGWPLRWEQFVHERLIVEVLGIGIRVLDGVARTVEMVKETVKGETVRCAVKRLMGDGEEAASLKKRVNEYKNMARSAVEEGGSSHANMSQLIQDLHAIARDRRNKLTTRG